MSIDLKTQLATEEYVQAINEINSKYDLPICIVENILTSILNQVTNFKVTIIQEEREQLERQVSEQKDKNKNKKDKVDVSGKN